jgi:hypothetical protein
MIEIIDNSRLIELVLEKHKKLLETYGCEFSEIESKFNMLKQQSDAVKKEIDSMGSRIEVLNENIICFSTRQKNKEKILLMNC